MENKEIISYFKKGKFIQLVIVIALAVCFFLTLLSNAQLRDNIYSNGSLMMLCAFVWILIILYLIGIFFDFYKLNSFNNEEDRHELKKFMEESNGILNRFSCDTLFKSDEVKEVLDTVGCSMLEIRNLKDINEKFGRDAGDKAIDDFIAMLEEIGNDYGIVVRNGGNEYLIVIADCTDELIHQCLQQLENRIALYNEKEGPNPLDIHYTCVLNSEQHFERFSEIMTLAYKQLHTA